MRRLLAALRKRLVSIPDREVLVATRGFDVTEAATVRRLEDIGRAFVAGYNTAVASTDLSELQGALESYRHSLRGFAYEGASMGLAIVDFMTPFSKSWSQFAGTFGASHIYMVHVGYGWALARLPVSTARALRRLEEPLRWLAMDGYGFHQGYFHWPKYIRAAQASGLNGYAARAFDQGLGRSLWFVCGAEPGRIERAITQFDIRRAPDLWAGVGLAAAYAGGASRSDLDKIHVLAGSYAAHVAQGAAFAAEARLRAGNPIDHTELACRVLCGMSLEGAAQIARDCYPSDMLAAGSEDSYEIWRTRIRNRFSEAALGVVG
jgi:enediyne biosynthesis protein E3